MKEQEEFTFDESPAERAAEPVTAFFKQDIKDAVVGPPPDMPTFGPEDVDALAETPMAYKEVCEPLLKELYAVVEKRKSVKKYEDELKAEFTKLVGKERGMIQRGAFGAKVHDIKGAERTDWDRFVACVKEWAHHHMGDAGKADIEKMLLENRWPGVPNIAITPYMVGPGDKQVD